MIWLLGGGGGTILSLDKRFWQKLPSSQRYAVGFTDPLNGIEAKNEKLTILDVVLYFLSAF